MTRLRLIVYGIILLIIIGYLHIKEGSSPSDLKKIDSLNFAIKMLDVEKTALKVEIKNLKQGNDSLQEKINTEKIKIIKTIEYRNKENIIIKSMPDGELFQLFSKFDSISHKNR